MKNENQRCYRITDSELSVYVDKICGIIIEDLPSVEEYGITEQDISEMKELNDIFKWLPIDSAVRTDVSLLVKAKNDMREAIMKTMKSMSQRVALKWGDKSQEFQQLGSQMLSIMSQIELLSSARTVHTMMTEYQPNLTEFGLTQAILDEYNAMINQYEANISERIKIEQTRTEDTINRIATGNELYDMLRRTVKVAKLAVPHKAEFYNMPQPRKKRKKESEADGE